MFWRVFRWTPRIEDKPPKAWNEKRDLGERAEQGMSSLSNSSQYTHFQNPVFLSVTWSDYDGIVTGTEQRIHSIFLFRASITKVN